MKKQTIILISIGILILAVLFYNIIRKTTTIESKQYNNFAECLTERGFIMAGTDWCPHCQNQKAMFGESFKHIDYRDCDIHKEYCIEQGVKGYPTWILPDGTLSPGVKQLAQLSQMSGCSLK